MDIASELKRIFFPFEVAAPWPHELPPGRLLAESDRHLTVAFLGETDYPALTKILDQCPQPSFKIGKGGIFNRCLFLPERHPNVVAWEIEWLDESASLNAYHTEIVDWLKSQEISVRVHKDGFLPHVTICRKPFRPIEWERAFMPLPMMIKSFNLYESLGNSRYRPCWSYLLKAPFEELEHTADVAFLIRGENLLEIYHHARIALAFSYPQVIHIATETPQIHSLDDIIIHLNEIVTRLDQQEGCPFKAVSFHGDLKPQTDSTLEWEMIVDV